MMRSLIRLLAPMTLVAALSACVITAPAGRAVSLGGGDILLHTNVVNFGHEFDHFFFRDEFWPMVQTTMGGG